jgi:hypothetical protein
MSLADQLKSVKLRSTNQPKEKFHEQLLCPDSETYRTMMDETQFECYYEQIKPWTFPSMILSINQDDIKALHDGHIFFKNSVLDNDEKKTEECFQKYPELVKLSKMIDSCDIQRPIFVRLSTRSPKDAVLLMNKEKFKQLFRQVLNDIEPDQTSGLIFCLFYMFIILFIYRT